MFTKAVFCQIAICFVMVGRLMSALGHVWTAPPWQELSELLQHWSGGVCAAESAAFAADFYPPP
jgi:hypothetical protein